MSLVIKMTQQNRMDTDNNDVLAQGYVGELILPDCEVSVIQ